MLIKDAYGAPIYMGYHGFFVSFSPNDNKNSKALIKTELFMDDVAVNEAVSLVREVSSGAKTTVRTIDFGSIEFGNDNRDIEAPSIAILRNNDGAPLIYTNIEDRDTFEQLLALMCAGILEEADQKAEKSKAVAHQEKPTTRKLSRNDLSERLSKRRDAFTFPRSIQKTQL